MTLAAERLVGVWTFAEWTIARNGQIARPFQPDPDGLLIYTADGIMSATIFAGGRKPFASADIRKQPDADKAAAFDSYFHYAGTWHIDGETVVHRVTMALNPNLVGTTQVRTAAFAGDRLTLGVEEPLEGGRGSRLHRLTWRRFRAAS